MPPRIDPITRDLTDIKNQLDNTLQLQDTLENRLQSLEISHTSSESRFKLIESKVDMLNDMVSLVRNNLDNLSYIVKEFSKHRPHSPQKNRYDPKRNSYNLKTDSSDDESVNEYHDFSKSVYQEDKAQHHKSPTKVQENPIVRKRCAL